MDVEVDGDEDGGGESDGERNGAASVDFNRDVMSELGAIAGGEGAVEGSRSA